MAKKIIIVGGVAGGATAAARLRRLDETAEIIMLERGKYVSYANCGLPYYVGDVIESRDSLMLQTPESLKQRYELDVRVEEEVTAIDRTNKSVSIRRLKSGEEYTENYDVLLLATGAEAVKPPIPGIETADNLFTLRSVEDADSIKGFIKTSKLSKAVIVGAGFIGLEIAENLKHQGLEVTVVEMLDQVMGPLDPELAAVLESHIREQGVKLELGNGVKSFSDNGHTVELSDGSKLEAELVIFAIGVKPEHKLASEAGLECSDRGGVIVNNRMQTSDPAIYAIGDMVQVYDRVSGAPVQLPLAWPANRQARIAADNISGKDVEYKGTLGAAVFKCFDLTAAMSGNNEKQLKKQGRKFQAIHIHPGSHAGYYPGASNMAMKLLYDPENGNILGAQCVGLNGVDKRMDVLNVAIQTGVKAWELQDLELCYAPPYSSAKDPVNMLGYVAENIRMGLIETVQWHELAAVATAGVILDVGQPEERVLGEIPGSLNVPLPELRSKLANLDKSKVHYVYCQVGLRGYIACRMLNQNGIKAVNIDGGYRTWAAMYVKEDQSSQVISDSGQLEKLPQPVKSNFEGEIPAMQTININACGLQCPGPLIKVAEAIKALNEGDKVEALATDPAFPRDIESWALKTGNTVVSKGQDEKGQYQVVVQKGAGVVAMQKEQPQKTLDTANSLTMIVFDGDLDKALAAFIIANGALAFGKEVTIFFTFWGLNVLRKDANVPVQKNFLESMFGAMMPKGPKKLGLSKMNMAGMGPAMIKYIMKQKNVDSLPTLMETALKNGAKLIACTMSMDIMGIKEEELIDGIELGGVATYLGKASEGNINLFV